MSITVDDTNNDYWKHSLVKATTVAATSAGTSMWLNNVVSWPKNITLFGTRYPSWVVTGALFGVSSLLADGAHRWILPLVSVNNKWSDSVAPIVAAGVAGASAVVLATQATPKLVSAYGFGRVAATAAVMEMTGSLLYESVVSPYFA